MYITTFTFTKKNIQWPLPSMAAIIFKRFHGRLDSVHANLSQVWLQIKLGTERVQACTR